MLALRNHPLKLRALLAAAFFVLAPVSGAAAANRGQERASDDPRARWEKLDSAERERIRERFERYRDLDAGKRESLEERARYLHEAMRNFERRLPVETRERIAGLDPARRRQVLRELALQDLRERGERILASMPPEWRERIEAAPPMERARILFELQGRMRERGAPRSIDHLARELELAPQEVERLKSLPPEERMRIVPELHKRCALRRAEREGPPPFVTAEQLREWAALPPHEFFERFEGARRAHDAARGVESGPGPGMGPGPGGARPGSNKPDVRRVLESLRPTPEDLIETANLPEDARRTELLVRARARALVVLRETRLLPPERLAEIEALTPEELRAAFEELRATFEHRFPRRGSPPRGDMPPRGEGPPRGDGGQRGSEMGPRGGPPR